MFVSQPEALYRSVVSGEKETFARSRLTLRPQRSLCSTSVPSAPSRGRHQGVPRELQDADGVLARDIREFPEELVQRMTRFEVLDPHLDRDTGASEDSGAAKALGRTCEPGSWRRRQRRLLTRQALYNHKRLHEATGRHPDPPAPSRVTGARPHRPVHRSTDRIQRR